MADTVQSLYNMKFRNQNKDLFPSSQQQLIDWVKFTSEHDFGGC